MSIRITSQLFDAFLKCPAKCFLQSRGATGQRNSFAEWARIHEQTYLDNYIENMTRNATSDEYVLGPAVMGDLKMAKWNIGVRLMVQTQKLETIVEVMERVPSSNRSHSIQIIPVRFTFANKLTRNNRLLLVFDSLVLSEMLRHKISVGKIIHGDNYASLKVKTDTLDIEVRKIISKITVLLSMNPPRNPTPNRHCAECEFQSGCRQKAIEHDDLSLLSNLSERERKKLNDKGIFTLTQLSYTFRPRRKSKRFPHKQEKYHHSLKALAIRQRKIHVVGRDELKIEGTPVYLDVEGIPDSDFYYLIGIRIRIADKTIQHSLWAETRTDEKRIWNKFIDILSGINDPVIVHYGSFETTFLKQMCNRYGGPAEESIVAQAINNPINLLSFIYARIYFPTYSNGLKDVAEYLGFSWAGPIKKGIQTIVWRSDWERSQEAVLKQKLIKYNSEDCQALEYITEFAIKISAPQNGAGDHQRTDVVNTDFLVQENFYRFHRIQFSLPMLEETNRAAYWDYQHEKIILRSSKRLKKIAKAATKKKAAKIEVNKIIHWPAPQNCLHCGQTKLHKNKRFAKTVLDIQFGRSSIKKWVTNYVFCNYRCPTCGTTRCNPDRIWSGSKYGPNLRILSVYLHIDLRMPQSRIADFINQIFGFNLSRAIINKFKTKAALSFKTSYERLLQKIASGKLIQVDETHVISDGKVGYIWAFTSMQNVAYIYMPSREGDFVQTMLKDFKGVLVTDFYSAYDSINCRQQKCLIHLIRDMNDDLLKEPFNEEIKVLTSDFANLLRSIIATVDRFGLKTRFLRKHKKDVQYFFRRLYRQQGQTEVIIKWKKRLEKNHHRLFTFLDYDNVPWNNNNAEHAIKAIAYLRRDLGGMSTEKGISDYLILLSIRETCKFHGVNFLDFLRSGEKDIEVYINNRFGHSKAVL